MTIGYFHGRFRAAKVYLTSITIMVHRDNLETSILEKYYVVAIDEPIYFYQKYLRPSNHYDYQNVTLLASNLKASWKLTRLWCLKEYFILTTKICCSYRAVRYQPIYLAPDESQINKFMSRILEFFRLLTKAAYRLIVVTMKSLRSYKTNIVRTDYCWQFYQCLWKKPFLT